MSCELSVANGGAPNGMTRTIAGRLTLAGAMLASATPVIAQTGASAEPASEAAEIIVTANRREESINKVSASIAAYGQDALDNQGIRDFADIVAQTPGLSAIERSTFQPPNIAIRGIQSVVGAATTGVYIDDTPVQTRNSNAAEAGDTFPALFDIGRVEVLRGPQGTLFGSGAEGGAVRFISPVPSLKESSIYGRAELAQTDRGGMTYEIGLAGGTPIVAEHVGLRLSASYRRDGGYVDRINERTGAIIDDNSNIVSAKTFKAAVNLQPGSSGVTIIPSFNFQETRGRDGSQYYVRLSRPDDQILRSGRLLAQPFRDRFYLPALKVEADLGDVTFVSVSSYFGRRQSATIDYSALDAGLVRLFTGQLPLPALLPADYTGAASRSANRQDNFTQELRLQSVDAEARLSWTVGAFYQSSKQALRARVDDAYYASFFSSLLFGTPAIDGIANYTTHFRSRDKQLAGFFNADYRLTDTIKATIGGRVAETRFSFIEDLDGPLNGGPRRNTGKQKETPFTPKFAVTWQPDDDNLAYLSASKGFRVGGANRPIAQTPTCVAALQSLGLEEVPAQYDSDTVWSYELGAKIALADNRVRINASVYHIDWSNIQQFVNLRSCASGFIANLGSANSDGFDLAISARPVDPLTLSLSVGYNKTRYGQTITSNGLVLAEKGAVASDTAPWQITATVDYSFDAAGGEAYVRLTDQYKSRNGGRFSRFENPAASGYDPGLKPNEGYNSINARLGWRAGKVDASLFMDNVFDAHPELNYIHNTLPTDATYYATTIRPRTIGMTVIFKD